MSAHSVRGAHRGARRNRRDGAIERRDVILGQSRWYQSGADFTPACERPEHDGRGEREAKKHCRRGAACLRP